MIKEFKCPVCGGKIGYKRVDDQERVVVVNQDGSIDEVIEGKSDGYTQWVCITDKNHVLPSEFIKELEDDGLLDTVEDALC